MNFYEAMEEITECIESVKNGSSVLYDYDPYQDKECTWTEEQKGYFMEKINELNCMTNGNAQIYKRIP